MQGQGKNNGKTYTTITLVWASIHCESKMEKQHLQTGDFDDRIQILQPSKINEQKTKSKPDMNHERWF